MKKRILAVILCAMVFLPTAAYGEMAIPSKLEVPTGLKAELRNYEDGRPYFYLEFKIPKSILDLDSERPGDGSMNYEIDTKVDNGEWEVEEYGQGDGGGLYTLEKVNEADSIYSFEREVLDEGGITTVDIKAHTYSYRVRFLYTYTDENGDFHDRDFTSAFSNVATIGTGTFYKGASAWAVPELDKAQEYGFITDRIKDNMSGPITREEFAEVAVKLYEKYTGKAAAYTDMSAFVDTQNPEIFKAYDLKIVSGIDTVKKLFAPKELTNREQVAAMLYRAVKAINPDADLSTAGAPSFSDEKQISNWALENVKFMSKNGFILGSGGKFDPKGTCTREMAVLIAVRVYEKYAGISR